MAVGADLQTAISLHQAGRLAEAEQVYVSILRADPRNADALHLLGLLAHQAGRHDVAVQLIGQAISLQPLQAAYRSNLGEVFRLLGRRDEARASFAAALQCDPRLVSAHYNLGLLLGETEPAEARRSYEQAIRLQPNFAAAHNNLGNLLRSAGQLDEAVAAYRAALRADSGYAEALGNLAATLVDRGDVGEAIELLERGAAQRPDVAEVHFNLGNAYRAAERWNDAAASYRRAVAVRPGFAEAQCNLGNALKMTGDLDGASVAYQAVLAEMPQHVDALVGLGAVLQSQGRNDDALELFDRAVAARPDSAVAHFNRGNTLMFKRERNAAVAAYQAALHYQPDYHQAYANLAIIFNDAGMPDQALEYCRKGLELGDTFGELYGNIALALHAQGKGLEALAYYRQSLALRPDSAADHSNLIYAMNFVDEFDPPALHAEHLDWARRHAEPLTAQAAPLVVDRTPARRLRIGYVSCHFREHAVNFFVEPILASHDHGSFEVFGYATVQSPDAATRRLAAAADVWRDVQRASDEQLAEIVRQDQIDILVDLNGHMGQHRLLTFARRPAPIQVTYIGYQNTTGMSAMDYRLTDQWADPPGLTDPYYTEELWRLPRAFFCYQPFETPDVTPSPWRTAGSLTFGSFNNYAKVTPRVVDAWLNILARVPDSRLLVLAYKDGVLESHWKQLAGERGIDPARIEMANKCFRSEYLELVARADIALDPFPFNGHTTTCDSIWMGVPVVMLAGQTYASRFGGSVLRNVGLDELIAASVDDYIERAVALARDRERLSALREELRPRMAASPLLDFPGFTRRLEDAYRQMWRRWCERHAE